MNLSYIRAMRHQAEAERARLATSDTPQAPNAPRVDRYPAPGEKAPTRASNDPHGHLPVEEALRADVVALCRSGALDTPHTEKNAVEQWAKRRHLKAGKAWRLWITYAAQSGAHRTPFFALTRTGAAC